MHKDILEHSAWRDYVDIYQESHTTADYWERKAKGKPLPDNAFRRIKYEVMHPPIRDEYGRDWYPQTLPLPSAYAIGTPLPRGGPWHDDLKDQCQTLCRNELLEKVREYPLNVGVTLAEYRETSDFVASCITSVAKSYRYMRKLQLRKAFKALGIHNPSKEWANKWLQWKYAVKPLVEDSFNAVEAYVMRSAKLDGLLRYEVKANKTQRFTDESEWSFTHDPTTACTGYSQIIGKIRCHGVIRFGVTDPLVYRLDQLGVLNPALIVWEKVPYSFVLDWFFPVGNWLCNVVPPRGVKFLGGTLSTYIVGGAVYNEKWGPKSMFRGQTSQVSNWEKTYEREVLQAFPPYKFPPIDVSLTVNKMVTALALLTQVRMDR